MRNGLLGKPFIQWETLAPFGERITHVNNVEVEFAKAGIIPSEMMIKCPEVFLVYYKLLF
jgi:hypothetical protein